VTDEPHAKAWDEAKVLNWFWDWAEDVDEVFPARPEYQHITQEVKATVIGRNR